MGYLSRKSSKVETWYRWRFVVLVKIADGINDSYIVKNIPKEINARKEMALFVVIAFKKKLKIKVKDWDRRLLGDPGTAIINLVDLLCNF